MNNARFGADDWCPQSVARFAADHWETGHLLVRANEQRRAFFGGCLDCEALDALLKQREAGADRCRSDLSHAFGSLA